MASPVHKTQHIVLRNLTGKTHAAGTKDAALVIEHDPLPQIHILGFLDLVFRETTRPGSVLHGELLQLTLPRLIADRAVQRMVDQKELHHSVTTILHQGGIGPDSHAWGDAGRATNLRSGHPGNLRLPVCAENRFSIRPHLGGSHFKQTHPAISNDRKLGMIAVMRDEFLGPVGHLDHVQAPGHLHPDPIDLHINQILFVLGHIVVPGIHGVVLTTAHGWLNESGRWCPSWPPFRFAGSAGKIPL